MNRLKELRVEHGYKSQADLARVLHVNQTAVSQWERGVTTPSPPILKKLSEMYQVSIEYLLGYNSIANANAGFYKIDDEGNRYSCGDPVPPASYLENRPGMPIDALWAQLNSAGQAALLDYADTLVSSGKYARATTKAAARGGGVLAVPADAAEGMSQALIEDDADL